MWWYSALVVTCALWSVDAIVGGRRAAVPPPDEAVVFISKFGRDARIEGTKNAQRGYYQFQGIRLPFAKDALKLKFEYAEPAVGDRRFQRAQLRRLAGDEFATVTCAPCPQPGLKGNEDCLCLNIFTPHLADDTQGAPVLFWIHGGGFRYGSANYYGGKHLTEKNAILVSIQYRLGTLGFLSTGDQDMSGNVGLSDIVTAYQWVQQYIEFFGGAPDRITLGGQGSGASVASMLALAGHDPAAPPTARSAAGTARAAGSPAGVLAMSGAPLSVGARDLQPRSTAAMVARANGCPEEPTNDMVDCLRKLDAENIVESDSKVQDIIVETNGILSAISGILGPAATVDGKFDDRALPRLLPEDPADLLRPQTESPTRDPPPTSTRTHSPPPPLLTGVTAHETTYAVYGDFKDELSKNVKNIPDYMNKVVLKPLQRYLPLLVDPLKELDKVIPLSALDSTVGKIVPLDLNRYYSLIDNNKNGILNITSALLKIAEATGDVLFNLPAFLSAQYWSQGSSAYLYNFEHVGKKIKGKHFLGGLPILGNESDDNLDDYVSHGDDLAYLFEPLDVNGNSVDDSPNETTREKRQVDDTEDDDKVRDVFTSLVAKFLHTGKLSDVKNKGIPSFSNQDNSFINIGKTLKIGDKFRYCQMGLWGGLESRLKTSTCSTLGVAVAGVSETIDKIISPTKMITQNILPLQAAVPTVPGRRGAGTGAGVVSNVLKPTGFGFFNG